MIRLDADRWLSELMAVDAYRVSGSLATDEAEAAGAAVRGIAARPSFAYARIGSSDLTTVQCLETLAFHVVDTNVTLETAALSPSADRGNVARAARPDDAQAVEQIARTSFEVSRFHLDPRLRPGLAHEIKAQWAANFFHGQRGDFMVVAESEGVVAGFLQLLMTTDSVLVIDLIAVARPYRGRGLAEAMIRHAGRTCGKPAKLRVGTQVANVGSLALYQRLGFKITASAYVLHFHGGTAGGGLH
jgi:ribosomal protein S18 acetylase RimI-like enzyme